MVGMAIKARPVFLGSASWLGPHVTRVPKLARVGRPRARGQRREGEDRSESFSPRTPQPTPEQAQGTLQEYLKFGRLMGDRVQDVQRQLELNNTPVVVDESSLQYLEEWQTQQKQLYSMFESIVDDGGIDKPGLYAKKSKKLEKNKNVAVSGLESLANFVEKEYGESVLRPTASQRKLAKNKNTNSGSIVAEAERSGKDKRFSSRGEELAMPRAPRKTPALAQKPKRPGVEVSNASEVLTHQSMSWGGSVGSTMQHEK